MAQQTFRDFVFECEMFPYSQENYDLLKECSELALMEQYLANQEFMAENAAELASDSVCITEGFMMESASDEKISALMEEVEAKKKSLWEKIVNAFKRLIRKVVNFFKNLGKRLVNFKNKVAEAFKKVEKIELNADMVEKIEKLIDDTFKPEELAMISTKQPYGKKKYNIKFTKDAFKDNDQRDKVMKVLATLTATESIRIVVGDASAVPPAILTKVVEVIKKPDAYTNSTQVNGAARQLDRAVKDGQKYGLVITVDPDALSAIFDEMEKGVDGISVDTVPGGEMDEKTSKLYEEYQKLLALFTKCTSDTMKVYANAMGYIQKVEGDVLNGLLEIVTAP